MQAGEVLRLDRTSTGLRWFLPVCLREQVEPPPDWSWLNSQSATFIGNRSVSPKDPLSISPISHKVG
jgi:hypothetical protein